MTVVLTLVTKTKRGVSITMVRIERKNVGDV